MPDHGSDHSSSFPRRRCATAALEKSVIQELPLTYQNFRKGSYQSFWNSQIPTIHTDAKVLRHLLSPHAHPLLGRKEIVPA
jgi:hypothetical protein